LRRLASVLHAFFPFQRLQGVAGFFCFYDTSAFGFLWVFDNRFFVSVGETDLFPFPFRKSGRGFRFLSEAGPIAVLLFGRSRFLAAVGARCFTRGVGRRNSQAGESLFFNSAPPLRRQACLVLVCGFFAKRVGVLMFSPFF